jgi:hypothetical protein
VARDEADQAGDVDLFVVVRDEKAVQQFITKTQSKAEKLVQEGWSLMLEVNVSTRKQLIGRWSSSLVRKIRREGRVVAGMSLDAVKHGSRS